MSLLYCVYSGDRLYIYTHRVDGGLLETYGIFVDSANSDRQIFLNS